MANPDPSPINPASAERLVSELNSMRDAAVRLTLALADYQFFVGSAQQSGAAQEVDEILAKIKVVRSN